MLPRLLLGLLLSASLRGCVVYEYEHEFWLRVDGSGSVSVTGTPKLWVAFKGLGRADDPEGTATREAARALFERSGLRVRRVTLTQREGRPYLSVSADFGDVNRLSGSAAFPDIHIGMRPEKERLVLEGSWRKPSSSPAPSERDGLMAVRFHLPSKVYAHQNAVLGVERGNIASWRQEVAQALEGRPLDFGATMDQRSILGSTVALFATAIALALGILTTVVWMVVRRGRRQRA